MAAAGTPRAGSGWPQQGTADQAGASGAGKGQTGRTGSPNSEPTDGADGRGRATDFTIPTEQIVSAATTAVMTPIAMARRMLPAKGGVPVYAGLGGLALVGVLEWPVAVAAGAGYGLARLWAEHEERDGAAQRGAAQGQSKEWQRKPGQPAA